MFCHRFFSALVWFLEMPKSLLQLRRVQQKGFVAFEAVATPTTFLKTSVWEQQLQPTSSLNFWQTPRCVRTSISLMYLSTDNPWLCGLLCFNLACVKVSPRQSDRLPTYFFPSGLECTAAFNALFSGVSFEKSAAKTISHLSLLHLCRARIPSI